MKKTIILLTIIFFYTIACGQANKNIVITTTSKTVPLGKKWIIETGNRIRIQINQSTINSGSFCNALFLSNPGMLSNINSGDLNNINSYMFLFSDIEKVQCSNDYTYDITVVAIVDKEFSITDLQNKELEKIGIKRLEFISGESVFVENCIESIELREANLTHDEILAIKKNENDAVKRKQDILMNFNIYNICTNFKTIEKPETHDNKLKSIVFSSNSVMHRQPEKSFAVDNESKWSLELNTEKFTMHSSNGIDNTYKLIKIEYDEQLRMQKFILGNSSKVITHHLLILWLNDHYLLILKAIDKSEEYQFQTVQAANKQFQN